MYSAKPTVQCGQYFRTHKIVSEYCRRTQLASLAVWRTLKVPGHCIWSYRHPRGLLLRLCIDKTFEITMHKLAHSLTDVAVGTGATTKSIELSQRAYRDYIIFHIEIEHLTDFSDYPIMTSATMKPGLRTRAHSNHCVTA